MAAASETLVDHDGFEMTFRLEVFHSLSQNVEDVARQGALGNFRKARSMYEEALEGHRDKFPIYAEFLRLCLDGEDWGSLAEASKHGDEEWSDLATSLVSLLHEVGKTMLQDDSQLPTYFTTVYTTSFKLLTEFAPKALSEYGNEEVCPMLRGLEPG